MNTDQKRVLLAVLVAVGVTFLYPPFQVIGAKGTVLYMGYAWLFAPPWRAGIYASVNSTMLLLEWMAIIIIGAIAFFLTRAPNNREFERSPKAALGDRLVQNALSNITTPTIEAHVGTITPRTGVRGWLLVLIIGMMLFGPFFSVGQVGVGIFEAERVYPALAGSAKWSDYKTWLAWVAFGFAAISFWGGLGLALKREWSAVTRAITVLWISGPGAALLIGLIFPYLFFDSAPVLGLEFLKALFGSGIAAAIWSIYLAKSTRVSNTYPGRNESNLAITDEVVAYISSAELRNFLGYLIFFLIVIALLLPQFFVRPSKTTVGANTPETQPNTQPPVITPAPATEQRKTTTQSDSQPPVGSTSTMSVYYSNDPSPLSHGQIAKIQTLLAQLGYSPGPPDGKAGEQTRNAISNFEQDSGMMVTGKPGEQFLSVLQYKFDHRRDHCMGKTTLTDADYRACGLRPPR